MLGAKRDSKRSEAVCQWYGRSIIRKKLRAKSGVIKKSPTGTGRASLLGSDKLEKSITASQWTSLEKNLGSFV